MRVPRCSTTCWRASTAGASCCGSRTPTPTARRRAFSAGALQADIAWLGLHWDEGPDRGGASGPYRQSRTRRRSISAICEQLEQAGLRLSVLLHAARARALAPRAARRPGARRAMPGTCLRLTRGTARGAARRRAQPEPALPCAPGRALEFEDLVYGPQRFVTDDIGDFIIRRESGRRQLPVRNADRRCADGHHARAARESII